MMTEVQTCRRTDRISSGRLDPFCGRVRVKIRNLPFKNQSHPRILNLHDLSYRGQYIEIILSSELFRWSGRVWTDVCETTNHVLHVLIFYTWEQGTSNNHSMDSVVKNDFQLQRWGRVWSSEPVWRNYHQASSVRGASSTNALRVRSYVLRKRVRQTKYYDSFHKKSDEVSLNGEQQDREMNDPQANAKL